MTNLDKKILKMYPLTQIIIKKNGDINSKYLIDGRYELIKWKCTAQDGNFELIDCKNNESHQFKDLNLLRKLIERKRIKEE